MQENFQVQYWPIKLLVETTAHIHPLNSNDDENENSTNYSHDDEKPSSLREHEIIGCCGLRPYDLDHHIYEMGIHLKVLGKGLCSRGLPCSHGFCL